MVVRLVSKSSLTERRERRRIGTYVYMCVMMMVRCGAGRSISVITASSKHQASTTDTAPCRVGARYVATQFCMLSLVRESEIVRH